MTTAERTLYEHGHADEIKAAREALDELVEIGLRREAEAILGRPVATVLTARRCSDDTASHVLLLEPAAPSTNGSHP